MFANRKVYKAHAFDVRLTVKLCLNDCCGSKFHRSKSNPDVCWGRGFGKDECCVTMWYLPALEHLETNNMNHTSMAHL